MQVENEQKAQLPSKQGTSPEQTSAVEESIFKVSGHLSTISRNQKYFRTRENRNFATVESTEQRIVRFSMIQIFLIIAMGALQVFVVRFFFQVRLSVRSSIMNSKKKSNFPPNLLTTGYSGCAQGLCLDVCFFTRVVFVSSGVGSVKYAGCRAMRFWFLAARWSLFQVKLNESRFCI